MGRNLYGGGGPIWWVGRGGGNRLWREFRWEGRRFFFCSLFNTSYQLVNGVEEVLTYHVGHMHPGRVGLEGVEDGVSAGLVRLFWVWDDGLNEQWDLWKRAA